MKSFLVSAFLCICVSAFAQTPPIQPKTPDVKTPAPLVLPPPAEIAVGKQPLTAQEAVDIALKNQPLVGIAAANIEISRGRVQQATSNLLPNFTATGSYSKSTTFRGGGGSGSFSSPSQFTTNVSMDQLLFDFGRTRDSVRQQEALERAIRHTYGRTQQTVALNVRDAFYSLAQDLATVTISEGNYANRQRQLDEAQARLNSGLGAPSDVVQAKTNLADAAISLSSARDSALNGRVQLAQLMGIDPRTPITPAASAEPPVDTESDLQRLVETAMANRPDIKSAQEQVTAARYGVSFAQKGNLPKISAVASVGSRGPTDPLQTESGTLSINVTWNFFDSGFTAGAVREAKGSEEIARQTLIQVTQQAVADVSQAFVDIQSALQRVDLANTEVANATEFVRISEGRYTGGIGQFLDITNAQNSLFGAQRNLIQAQQDVERARARLRTAIGQL